MPNCTPGNHIAAPVQRHAGSGGRTITAECPSCGYVFWRAAAELVLDRTDEPRRADTKR